MSNFSIRSFLSHLKPKKETQQETQPILLSRVEEENLSIFSKEAESIQLEIAIISDLLKDLQNLHLQSKTVNSNTSLSGLWDRMLNDTAAIFSKAKIIKSRLRELDQSNVGNGTSTLLFRSGMVDSRRVYVVNDFRAKIREMMQEFQTLREGIFAEYKYGLTRMCHSATKEIVDDDLIDRMVSGDTQSIESVFKEDPDSGFDVLERNRRVKEIVKGMQKLQKVFADMLVVPETKRKLKGKQKVDQLPDTPEDDVLEDDKLSCETDCLIPPQATTERESRNTWSCCCC